jgi:hypothetical protein
MQQVAERLEKLGLAQYAQRFAENDISFALLPDLTDQDLKDWGVTRIACLGRAPDLSPITSLSTCGAQGQRAGDISVVEG